MEHSPGRQVYGRQCKRDFPGSDAERNHTSGQLFPRAKRTPRPGTGLYLHPRLSLSSQNQDESALRICTPGQVSTDLQSVESNGLVPVIICDISSPPVQSGEPFPDVKACELRRREHRHNMFHVMTSVVRDRNISYAKKTPELRKLLCKFLDGEEKANDDEIERWRVCCHSLREEKSILKKDNEVLKEEVNRRCRVHSQIVETLEAGFGAEVRRFEEQCRRRIFWVKKQYSVEEPVHATQTSVLGDLELSPRKNHDPQQVQQINCDSLVSTVKPQNCSQKDEPPEEPKRTQENEYKHNANCGSYTDAEAKPTLLCNHLPITRDAVTAFQRLLFECVETTPLSPWELLDCCPDDVFFARPRHSTHYFRSAVSSVFFEGFENESFNTMCGVSRFLDPNRRRENFYNYYLREREQESEGYIDRKDPQFEEFCKMKVYSFLRKTLPECNRDRAEISFLEKLGGPELGSTFRLAAKAVWLLHKLAFSFEPPATIFRVEEGAEFDPIYMESKIVQLDDDERLVPKVGFMIDPGLRLPRVPIMQCEVYLAGRATTVTLSLNN